MEQIYSEMENNMTEEQKTVFVKGYGSMETFKKQFPDHSSSEDSQEILAKVVDWYGGKERAKAVAANPDNAR